MLELEVLEVGEGGRGEPTYGIGVGEREGVERKIGEGWVGGLEEERDGLLGRIGETPPEEKKRKAERWQVLRKATEDVILDSEGTKI